jgi:hypothetical protein
LFDGSDEILVGRPRKRAANLKDICGGRVDGYPQEAITINAAPGMSAGRDVLRSVIYARPGAPDRMLQRSGFST